MKKILVYSIITFISIEVKGQQGISNVWLAGYQSWYGLPLGGIVTDFITGTPVINYKYIPMNFSTGLATISDSLGNIKLYTNGIWIAGANDDTILDGGGISPPVVQDTLGLWIPQSTLFLQKPNDTNIFYLIHSSNDDFQDFTKCYFVCYSIIDMSLNNGLGAVVSKNNTLKAGNFMLGNITACKHGNGRDWWITFLEKNTNTIYISLLTPWGLSAPVKMQVGTPHTRSTGQSVFSPDGNLFAFTMMGDTIHKFNIYLFAFDRCTGTFSNEVEIKSIDSIGHGRGISFSSNNQFMYVSSLTKVFQYDVTQTNIKSSEIIVAEWDSFYSPNPPFAALYSWMSLAPDGKIYISTGNSTFVMHIIDQPDSPGTACNFIQHGMQLPAYSVSAPPNHPNYFLGANGLCNNLSYESLESGKVKKVTVFGNPTHDKFTLWFPVDKDVGWLDIYDVNGNNIRRERVSQWSQYKTVDISLFAAGVYFCKMRWPSGEGSVKAVRLE